MIRQKKDNYLNPFCWLLTIAFLLLLFYFNYFLERTDFVTLISLYSFAFFIYLLLLNKRFFKLPNHFRNLLMVAILARFMLLFSLPNLSDDYFRFIWDGLLNTNGNNPFDYTPVVFFERLSTHNYQLYSLIANMNSPDYFSVYPPINQYIFSISTYVFPKNLSGAVFIMKLFMFSFELLSIFSIYKIAQQLNWNKNAVLWYALNPLIIIEFCGNLHFEGLMIAFILFSIYLLTINKWILSAVIFSGAILTKLHPLMLLPFFIKYLGWKKGISFALITGLCCSIVAAPLLLPVESILPRLSNIAQSLELYYQSFEFNAGIYYIFRVIGYKIYGYNAIELIGKILLILNIIGLALVFVKQKRSVRSLITSIALAYLIYSLLATTVHPWYILCILPFALLINFKTPLIWSGIVILSYFAYSTADWHENFYFIIIEYTLIFAVLIYELKTTKILNEIE